MITRHHSTATPVSLSVDDTVFKASPLRQSKLEPKFTGPFLIIESLPGHKFKIYDPKRHIFEIVHADRLKKAQVPITSSVPSLPEPPVSHTVPSTPTHSYFLRSRNV